MWWPGWVLQHCQGHRDHTRAATSPSEWWQLATGHQCHQCGHGPLLPWFRMTTTWTFLWDSFISFESQPDRRNVKKVTFKLLFLCSLHLTCLPSMNNDQENTRTCATWSRQSDSDRLIGVRSAIYFVTLRVWMINTKAVLTSSFHATKHDMQHCNPALGVIKLCNYSLDCWIYGLNDLNTDKTVVTRGWCCQAPARCQQLLRFNADFVHKQNELNRNELTKATHGIWYVIF